MRRQEGQLEWEVGQWYETLEQYRGQRGKLAEVTNRDGTAKLTPEQQAFFEQYYLDFGELSDGAVRTQLPEGAASNARLPEEQVNAWLASYGLREARPIQLDDGKGGGRDNKDLMQLHRWQNAGHILTNVVMQLGQLVNVYYQSQAEQERAALGAVINTTGHASSSM